MHIWNALVVSALAIALAPFSGLALGGEAELKLKKVEFSDLPGWADDNHAEALRAFRQSCAVAPAAGRADVVAALAKICAGALALAAADAGDKAKARAFFEGNFRPFRVLGDQPDGLMTGYYEPELEGSLKPDARFKVPVLRRPDDLVDVVPDVDRAAANAAGKLSSMRKTQAGLMPYFTRAEIEAGSLAGRGLEMLYLDNTIDLYLMQVQGSGSIKFAGGKVIRIGYSGKNGYPFTGAGGVMIREGIMKREDLTMQSMQAWLEAHPKDTTRILQENKSYVFFEERALPEGATGPFGGHGTPLTPRRSLAVDPQYHVLGSPVYVTADELEADGKSAFRHLMIAEDVGSAIRGPERGDIFWGTGFAAGEIAGRTKHRGHIYALLPAGMDAGK
jgi:membrane-bound lytic murein transglycosylase A